MTPKPQPRTSQTLAEGFRGLSVAKRSDVGHVVLGGILAILGFLGTLGVAILLVVTGHAIGWPEVVLLGVLSLSMVWGGYLVTGEKLSTAAGFIKAWRQQRSG